jgi:hypothetical protein
MKKTFPAGFYWGEKRWVRSDSISLRKRLPAILNKIATTCTVPVRKLFARGCQLFCKNSDNLYSHCK